MNAEKNILNQLLNRWRMFRGVEAILWAVFWTLLVGAFIYLFQVETTLLTKITGLTFATSLLAYLQQFRLFSTSKTDLVTYLNRQYPELEDSADLLLDNNGNLPALAILQKEKINNKLVEIQKNIRLPHYAGRAFLSMCFGALVAFGAIYLKPYFYQISTEKLTGVLVEKENKKPDNTSISPTKNPDVSIKTIKLKYTPPAYTNLSGRTAESPGLKAPQFSRLNWTIRFTGSIQSGFIVFQNADKISLQKKSRNTYTAEMTLEKTGLYSIEYTDKRGNKKTSDYYKLEAIPDVAPDISIKDLEPYAAYFYDTLKTISFKAHLTDDYGIQDARMVATLSRGEGEAVKFRDDTLYFKEKISGQRNYNLTHKLNLHKLGMEPGDELYLHVEATDNRRPDPQTSRTYKYIIAFEDTTSVDWDMEGKMALDRMPAYFRSQRQIIIDTEKLIAQKGKISTTEFNETSNNIAADQKILRLRYGRFLGEEFETVIGEVSSEKPEAIEKDNNDSISINITRSNADEEHGHHHHDHHHDHGEHCEHGSEAEEEHQSHQHNDDHEHGEHCDHDHDENHDHEEHQHHNTSTHQHDHSHGHDHGGGDETQEENPLEGYMHMHDNMEESTFFDQSTAAKLRASLSKMWDAELQLRLYQPEKALQYEYAALKLLKEVQQASRVYVERIGFEAPVINVAEKRLTGELEEIKNTESAKKQDNEKPYPAILESVDILEILKQENRLPNRAERSLLTDAGQELAGLALVRPGNYFATLKQIKMLTEGEVSKAVLPTLLTDIQGAFMRVLPDTRYEPASRKYSKNRLEKLYLRSLK